MAFRTIVIASSSKLELNLGYLVHRSIDETKRILIKEIHTLIIQSTAVSVSSALLAELIKNKIKVIFCDEKNNPISELVPTNGNVYTTKYIFNQINWLDKTRDKVWKVIIYHKIKNQSNVLKKYGFLESANQLDNYSNELNDGDTTNREGHAAKVYFNNIFGKDFSRSSENKINGFLNYGYSVLLSQINREICNLGYLTQIGVHHKNIENQFNFSCDLIEPFRPIVDDKAKSLKSNDDFKKEMINLLNINITIDGKNQTLYNAIKIYVSSVCDALNSNDITKIKLFTDYEL